ncbi:MAG TPA: GDP-mannose 4,6-dehydratase, partial [Sedimentisphaerales bacterium]|nr:GDP-mannose 4,6-dehydratase [Sedimentisphaerales bacterium]
SHLAERLLKAGQNVVVVDDLSTGSISNIAHLKKQKSFQFVRDTVRNASTMAVLAQRCDVIFHLAAAVGVQLIVDRPVHTIETNIHGTEVVLDAANRFGRKVLVASTSEVYGKSEAVPFREDDDMLLGSTRFSRWSYACSKAIDEFLAFAYSQESGLDVVVARLFNTVGPRQTGQYGMVVPRFVSKALQNEPIEIYGTGRQSRCFCCVGDVVEALVGLMESPKAAGKVFNVGTTEETTISDLADRVVRLTGSKSRKVYVDYKTAYGREMDDMMRRVPSIERIKKTIGWQPETSLDQTLKMIIRSLR